MFGSVFKKKDKNKLNDIKKLKLEHIILLGDNILDNFMDIDSFKNNIENELNNKLNKTQIINLSYANLNLSKALKGCQINSEYINKRKLYQLTKYNIDNENLFKPINILTQMLMNKKIQSNPKNSNKNHINPTVILSLGFNDMLFNLKYTKSILIQEALKTAEFTENLDKIIKIIINNLHLNCIVINFMEPHNSFTDDNLFVSRDDLLSVMEYTTQQIFKLCEKYKLPIIDLARTLDPFSRSDYGKTSTGLSDKSSKYLIDLIESILCNYNFIENLDKNIERKSIVYYGSLTDKNGILTEINDKKLRDKYFGILQARAPPSSDMDALFDMFMEDEKDGNNKSNKKSNDDNKTNDNDNSKHKGSIFSRHHNSNNNDNNDSKNNNNNDTNNNDNNQETRPKKSSIFGRARH